MKDYTLTEAKEILQKYFSLLPRGSVGVPNTLCGDAECESCLFSNRPNYGCKSAYYFDPEMIDKVKRYIKDHGQKVDWNKVPAGTPVLCWNKQDEKDWVSANRVRLRGPAEMVFLWRCKDGSLWSRDSTESCFAHRYECMAINETLVPIQESWLVGG